jgi:hypothetical protein
MRVSWPLFVIPFVGAVARMPSAEGLLVLSLGRPVEDAAAAPTSVASAAMTAAKVANAAVRVRRKV